MQPDSSFPLQVGQAVIYAPRPSSDRAVVPFTYGTITRLSDLAAVTPFAVCQVRVSIRPADGRRGFVTRADRVTHAGWCDACQQPAHTGPAGLVCPTCGRSADPTPPPETWALRAWPELYADWPLIVRRAVLVDPWAIRGGTERQLRRMVQAEAERRYTALCARFDVPLWDRGFGEQTRYQLRELAAQNDVAGFAALVLRTRQAAQDLHTLLDLAIALAGAPAASELPVPPADMPADDRTPDGEDDITRWLRTKMQRKAA